MILIPNSNSEDNRPLVEFNPCHGPNDGRFCSDATTRVGLTSYQTGKGRDDPKYRSVNKVLGADMREFATKLQAIPSVTNVTVQNGTGAFKAGWEPTWIIGYKGNGEARRLVAATAKQYDQQAVLFMHRVRRSEQDADPQGDPAVELHFRGEVNHPERKRISDVLRDAGLGGWTWGKRGGSTVLRAVSVPDWDSTTDDHLQKMRAVSATLRTKGYKHKARVKHVETEVIGPGDYDRVIGGE